MAFEGVAAILGLAYVPGRKKESVIEPFKRTLALANVEHEKAQKNLMEATEKLAAIANAKRENDAKS